MRSVSLFILTLLLPVALAGQVTLREVEVHGTRPLKDTGVERTEFDSVALRESVALSLADILTFNSSVFVKSHGRATLSTVAFRGTSPSHTQVTWNGMRINSPMLGMTDFSTIPSFFVDKASLLHGSSSVGVTGGAIGGVVSLSTTPDNAGDTSAVRLQYVQGVGSYTTFDEFLRFSVRTGRWSLSTRAALSTSPNDYKYINRDKKENIYDDDHNIVGQYHPEERNRSGAYRDLHVMQQIYCEIARGQRIGLDVWYLNTNRELPLITTEYGDERGFENRQREQTLRAVAAWTLYRPKITVGANAGYSYTQMAYDYKREMAQDIWSVMTRSRSYVNTLYFRGEASWYPLPTLMVNANIAAHQHFVRSRDKNIIKTDGNTAVLGYDKARLELSGAVSARWQPAQPLGLGVTLRQEVFGDKTAFIPAAFADLMLYRPANLLLKGSVSRNHRFPSLNDMYFLPGGNPDLRDESGLTYDAGFSAEYSSARSSLTWVGRFSANWFDSYIDDWIMWLPTTKGFFSPRNVRKVHAYGIEAKAGLDIAPGHGWLVSLDGAFSWTPSVNRGEKMSEADRSVGRQLPYVPRQSASLTARLTWRSWSLLYKWAYYSERYTMSSNDTSISGRLPSYYMSNIVIQKDMSFKPFDLQFKLAVNNLFNEEYLSVLSFPMPGINFEFFVTFTPRFY